MSKQITIKIDKKFIEKSLHEENSGYNILDAGELSKRIAEEIKSQSEPILRESIREVMLEIIRKDSKEELKKKVKSFIFSMSSDELFYRDKFRDFIVDLAKKNSKDINNKIKAFIDDGVMYKTISNSVGSNLADKFIKAIEQGKLSNN